MRRVYNEGNHWFGKLTTPKYCQWQRASTYQIINITLISLFIPSYLPGLRIIEGNCRKTSPKDHIFQKFFQTDLEMSNTRPSFFRRLLLICWKRKTGVKWCCITKLHRKPAPCIVPGGLTPSLSQLMRCKRAVWWGDWPDTETSWWLWSRIPAFWHKRCASTLYNTRRLH